MKDVLSIANGGFESSSYETPEFKSFYNLFKKDFTKLLTSFDCSDIEIHKGHFYISGFFKHKSQIWYFSLEDVRWNPTFLIRKATSYKDYTGGSNMFCDIDNDESFINDIKNIIGL
jgi:hypothetical protein